MIPDGEAVIRAYLAAHVDVAALVGEEIVPETPEDTSTPWVRFQQLDALKVSASSEEHLTEFLIQFDCYASAANDQAQASLIARTVRDALQQMRGGVHSGVHVTDVKTVSMPRLPDVALEPARERYVYTATILMHP